MRTWFCKGGHKSSLALALYGEAAGPRPDHVRFRSIDDVDAKGEMSKVGRKRDPCHRFSSVSRPVHRQDSIPSFPWFASTFSLRRHPHKFQPPNLQEEHDRGAPLVLANMPKDGGDAKVLSPSSKTRFLCLAPRAKVARGPSMLSRLPLVVAVEEDDC